MSDIERALARMAASTEFGLLTTEQVHALGLSTRDIRGLTDTDTLHRVAHGVYCLSPPTWLDRLRGVVRVQMAGRVVVSHRSAARLHGLWDGDELDVTVRYPNRARAAGFEVHRSRDLVAGVVTGLDGLPTTTVARTLCDLGLVIPPWEVRRIVEHAVATERVTVAELESVRWGVSEHGRSGVSAIDLALIAMPEGAAKADSGPEVRLMALMAGTRLPEVVPQYPVVVEGHGYRIDFAIPEAMVAIEYDGGDWHSTPEQVASDAVRQARLERAGWRVLRFDKSHLYSPEAGGILREIAEAIRDQRNRDL